jgi:tRNA-specific 2-thiouridylase
MTKMVAVGLSGGVDSSVAALLLKQQGYEVIGLYMLNWHDTTGLLHGDCPRHDDIVFAELVARKIGIPFEVVDLSSEYSKRVVDYLFNEYSLGRTPNPDVLCNREIKFDAFLKIAIERGADFIATGHYCQKGELQINHNTVYQLIAGADTNKDQSYFLCQLSQEMLSRTLFPIGHLTKSEVRKLAAEYDLATAERKDSQGICFVGKVDLPTFLQQKLAARKGLIIEIPEANFPTREWIEITEDISEEKLIEISQPHDLNPEMGRIAGEHNGSHFFTIGQRKGLHIGGLEKPLFVIGIDVEKNILYTGQGENHPGLYRQALKIRKEEFHLIRPDIEISENLSIPFQCRIRYRQPLHQARLFQRNMGFYLVFDKPMKSITSGQFAALYSGNELVASGVIHQ